MTSDMMVPVGGITGKGPGPITTMVMVTSREVRGTWMGRRGVKGY